MKVLHVPGLHHNLVGFPLRLNYGLTITREFTFTAESLYTLTKNPDDQADWNKLFGLATGINAQKNSVMFAWRCTSRQTIEATYYYHPADGSRQFGMWPHELAELRLGTRYEFEITIGYSFVWYQIKDLDRNCLVYILRRDREITWQSVYRVINSWFGGTSTPESVIKIF